MPSAKLKLKTSQVLNDGTHPMIIQVSKDGTRAITSIRISYSKIERNYSINLPKNSRLSLICKKKLVKMQELLFQGEDQEWSVKRM